MLDLYGLGNAIVDVEVRVEQSFLDKNGLAKGQMTLVDTMRMHELLTAIDGQPVTRCSGGSAANTIYAAAGFGLSSAYTCRLASDLNGKHFIEEMQQANIAISPTELADSVTNSSGQCLVMITDDAERTMATDLGVSSELVEADVDTSHAEESSYLYIEGYLSSSATSAAAAAKGRTLAQQAGKKVAVSLADVSMIEFFPDQLQNILGNGVELLFCNVEEALAWAKTDRLDIAIAELRDICPELYVTMGSKGSNVITANGVESAAGFEVKAVDTTGAGDIFAGACLAARAQGASPVDAARFANFAAAQLVALFGARFGSFADYAQLKKQFTV